MCKCKDLKVQAIHIDYRKEKSHKCPKAIISLGKDFAKTSLCVSIKALVEKKHVKKVKKVCTDCKGIFSVCIPYNTDELTLKIKIGSNKHSEYCQDCLRITEHFAPIGGYDLTWRTYSGAGNNLYNPAWGKSETPLYRQAGTDYQDGVSSLAVRGPKNPNPRIVSNSICKTTGKIDNSNKLTSMLWQFGQFLDHEIDLSHTGTEVANIQTPTVVVDPNEDFPNRTIDFHRTLAVINTSPREQPNDISAYIDGTNVYGHSSDRAFALRKLDGSGKLKTSLSSNGEVILPLNVDKLNNAPDNSPDSLLAGDIRANENSFLTALHSLFVREHNRLCDRILQEKPWFTGNDEYLFQHAKRIVSGEMQNITLGEFLPALIGSQNISAYTGYKPEVDSSIATEFSTVGYRLGHTMLSSSLKVGENGFLQLKDIFFKPDYVKTNGVDALLQGGSTQIMDEIDGKVIDDVRNSLFGPPTATHLVDLASLNIQRGRDHGIPGYNAVRVAYGLLAVTDFSEITSNVDVQTKLQDLYDHPDHIDPWIGALVEDHVAGLAVGPLLVAILKDQFERIRNGDRFYYENDPALSNEEKGEIRTTKLSDIIIRNTTLTVNDIPNDVFHKLD